MYSVESPKQQLLGCLKEVRQELQSYSINKKAFDQYVQYSDNVYFYCFFSIEQYEEFVRRQQELEEGHQSILNLIDVYIYYILYTIYVIYYI